MLALSRCPHESIVFVFSDMTDEQLLNLRKKPIELIVSDITCNKVKLAFEAPQEVKIHRKEVYQAIQNSKTIEEVWNDLARLVSVTNTGAVVYESPIVPRLTLNGFDTELIYNCIDDNIINEENGTESIDWENVRKDYEKQVKLDATENP